MVELVDTLDLGSSAARCGSSSLPARTKQQKASHFERLFLYFSGVNIYDVLIVGGGAAGFFAAINTATQNPNLKIAILERGSYVLSKVKISGGGRCNVTHAEFIPDELVLNYPRGQKELRGPFHNYMTGDTMQWFEDRGVPLKIEDDGRVFPVSNSSQTIIDCFLEEVKTHQIEVLLNHSVQEIKYENETWKLDTTKGVFRAHKLLIATGSNPKIWKLLELLGHQVISPVPSLFTFNGDVYNGIDAFTLDDNKITKAQRSLRILSGLYGVLKPLDLIQAYRLEMGTKITIDDSKNLYEFWKNKVTAQLQSELEAGELVVNLASKEYFGVIDTKALETQVVSPKFKDFKNGKLKIISFFAKKARGMMSRHLIEQNASTLEDIRSFTEAGYRFSEEETKNPMQPVFVR